jgi:hypothetical protein
MMDERRQPAGHSDQGGGPPSWFDKLTMRASEGGFLPATRRKDLILSLSKDEVGSHGRMGYLCR